MGKKDPKKQIAKELGLDPDCITYSDENKKYVAMVPEEEIKQLEEKALKSKDPIIFLPIHQKHTGLFGFYPEQVVRT